jgi:hypothetical protein
MRSTLQVYPCSLVGPRENLLGVYRQPYLNQVAPKGGFATDRAIPILRLFLAPGTRFDDGPDL